MESSGIKVLLPVVAILAAVLALIGYKMFHPFPGARARPVNGFAKTIDRDGRLVEYFTRGAGPPVVLLASAGRSVSDFNELSEKFVNAGYQTIAIEAPGIGGSDLSSERLSLFDLADDVYAVMTMENGAGEEVASAVIVGHAFGNRVARATAAKYQDSFSGVILLAAGGQAKVPKKAARSLRRSFDPRRTARQRLNDVSYGFFAKGNQVPDYWRRGWYRPTAKMQGAATGATNGGNWQSGGAAPMLIIQAAADRIAPKKISSDLLARAYPDRVEIIVIENAGHALLPEQPDAIAKATLGFLERVAPSQ